jgi:hypothetical protein
MRMEGAESNVHGVYQRSSDQEGEDEYQLVPLYKSSALYSTAHSPANRQRDAMLTSKLACI